MNSLPASVLEGFTEEVARSAGKVALRVGLVVAGFLAAMLAAVFVFAATYTGLVILVGTLAAQIGLAALFALAAAILFRAAPRMTRHDHHPAARPHPAEPPHDDWAGRMAGSVAYAFAEGLMRGRQKKADGAAPPGPDAAS
jgi:hypothetical protein